MSSLACQEMHVWSNCPIRAKTVTGNFRNYERERKGFKRASRIFLRGAS